MLNKFINQFRNSTDSFFSVVKVARRAIACAALGGFAAIAAIAAPADFDRTFGNNGRILTAAPNGMNNVRNVTVAAGDKILVLADSVLTPNVNQTGLYRYNADGTPDATFGASGKAIFDYGSVNVNGSAFAVQPDGKIVVVGTTYTGVQTFRDFIVIRFNADGTLDASFGTNGKTVNSFELGNNYEDAGDVLIQPDGKILVSGIIYPGGGNPIKPGLARLTAGGDLDTTFGTGGRLVVAVSGSSPILRSIAVQPDGKIVAVGDSTSAGNQNFLVVRLQPNGVKDTTFGTDGEVNLAFGQAQDFGTNVRLAPDGKILVGGLFIAQTQKREFALARLNQNGSLDTTFGLNNTGKTVAFFNTDNGTTSELLIQPDGKILLTGTTGNEVESFVFAAARFTASGTPDLSFGADGKTTLSVGSYSASTGAALQSNGRIVLAGLAIEVAQGETSKKLALARILGKNTAGDFDSDGKADVTVYRPSNGTWYSNRSLAGYVGVNFGAASDIPASADYDGDGSNDFAVYRPSNGTWYIQGSSTGFKAAKFGIALDTPQPADFDGDGKADIAVYRPTVGIWYVLSSSNNSVQATQFGAIGDKPIAGDFDRDGRADYAVFRPSNGTWYVLNSKTGGFKTAQFGTNGDVPQTADFDGDQQNDYAVFRPSNGTWYVLRSLNNQLQAATFGQAGDIPAARDYNGDGRADYAVFRPANGTWYTARREGVPAQNFDAIRFGANGDVPSN